jgi:pilus assembly protein CpaF
MSLLKRIEQGQVNGNQSVTNDNVARLVNLPPRRVPPPGINAQKDTYSDLKTRVQNRLLAELDPSMDVTRVGDVRNAIQVLYDQVLAEENIILSRPEGSV